MRRFHFVLSALVLLVAQPLLAKTYYVGSCKTGAYSTISAAVAAVPADSIIDVCPGTYPEQVVISQPLTLQGIASGGSAQADYRHAQFRADDDNQSKIRDRCRTG